MYYGERSNYCPKSPFITISVDHRFLLNPFAPNAPFHYPLKTSQNLTVFWRLQGVENGCIGNEWVNDFPFTWITNHFVGSTTQINLLSIFVAPLYQNGFLSSMNFYVNMSCIKWIFTLKCSLHVIPVFNTNHVNFCCQLLA